MANTMSAKKAIRQSQTKRAHNLFWKNRIKNVVKNIKSQLAGGSSDTAIINQERNLFYKIVDKAAKERVLHKNKAKRLKSKIAQEISKYENSAKPAQKSSSEKSTEPAKSVTKPRRSKSKS